MTKIAIPQSWRDLSHSELTELLDDHPTFFRSQDLVWAQWKVASAAFLAAMKAEEEAWAAERKAYDAWREKGGSRTLGAYEAAKATVKRRRATMGRLRRRADALYELHGQLVGAEA